MRAEIVMIGTELLLGQIVDSNSALLGRTLAAHGVNLFQKSTVGDNQARIEETLARALERADVVLTSGGLGPTEDDVTREAVAHLLDRPLELDAGLLEDLHERFARMKRPVSENNRKQAMLPRGARPISNPNGTAPGLLVDDERGVIICMPGVPHELEAMLNAEVIPRLRERFGVTGVLWSRVLKVAGVGESRIDERIGDLMRDGANPTVGVLASPDAVRIRISAKADSQAEAAALVQPVEQELRARLEGLILGADEDTLESAVDWMLQERGWSLAVAETATGGLLAQRLAHANAHSFAGGWNLPRHTPAHASAQEDAAALAEAVRQAFNAECGLALAPVDEGGVTAGVFLSPEGRHAWESGMPPSESLYAVRTAVIALEQVRRWLTGRRPATP
ncbi:MAG: CinA family nicotinamide mononucleotide deamidase-related protein [Candidatus Hydrogenedentota bacterium]